MLDLLALRLLPEYGKLNLRFGLDLSKGTDAQKKKNEGRRREILCLMSDAAGPE